MLKSFEKITKLNERIKIVKSIEKEYSQDIIYHYKEIEDSKERNNEFNEIILLYQAKCNEINLLKQKKQNILQELKNSTFSAIEQEGILANYIKEIEEKKKNFNIFMEHKGKEALKFFQNLKKIEEKNFEDLYKANHKESVRSKENHNSRIRAKELKELNDMKNKKELTEDYHTEQNFFATFLNKNIQPHHDSSTNINYLTSKFHNILVIKHGNSDTNAFDKALEERKRIQEEKILKKNKLMEFDVHLDYNINEIKKKQRIENINKLQNFIVKMKKKKINKINDTTNVDDNIIIEARLNNLLSEDHFNKIIVKNIANPKSKNFHVKDKNMGQIDLNEFYPDIDDQNPSFQFNSNTIKNEFEVGKSEERINPIFETKPNISKKMKNASYNTFEEENLLQQMLFSKNESNQNKFDSNALEEFYNHINSGLSLHDNTNPQNQTSNKNIEKHHKSNDSRDVKWTKSKQQLFKRRQEMIKDKKNILKMKK